MLSKRIIPCFDVKNGETVKGVNFENLRSAGDPVVSARMYVEQGADELVFLDITATVERRKTLRDLVRRVAAEINIPFTVGGGISSVQDVAALLQSGADKITINSAAVARPELVSEIAREFGSQCVVVAIDTKHSETGPIVFVNGGRTPTQRNTLEWAREVVDRGGGEILLTSMDHDGTKCGFALEITAQIASELSIPVIASGGAGTPQHFYDVFTTGNADAALAASIFHFGEVPIPVLKDYLAERAIPVRR